MRREWLCLALCLATVAPAGLRAQAADDRFRLTLPQAGGGAPPLQRPADGPGLQSRPETRQVAPQDWGDNCGYVPPEARTRPST